MEPPKQRSKPRIPLEHRQAAKFIDKIRERYIKEIDAIESSGSSAGTSRSALLIRVVNTNVEDINSFDPMKDVAGPSKCCLELPYDGLIVRIMWEWEDNPEVIGLIGLGPVEDLVGFFEAASLCESRYGHYKENRRLVYSSMWCLYSCMETLRLSSQGLLNPQPHSHCSAAGQCVSPCLQELSNYAFRYAEALDTAFFHRHKGRPYNWLLIFYSLRIQSYVRRALMVLEQRQFPGLMNLSASNASQYLWDAVALFRGISMRNNGKLAAKIRDLKAQPSVYLQQQQPQPRLSVRIGIGRRNASTHQSWETWHQEGVIQHLERSFEICAIAGSTDTANGPRQPLYQQPLQPVPSQQTQPAETPSTDNGHFNLEHDPDSDPESDADGTKTPTAQTIHHTQLTLVDASASVENSLNSETGAQTYHCQTDPSSPDPSNWSITSLDPNSAAPSFFDSEWAESVLSSTASDSATMTSSRRSFSTIVWDDYIDFDANAAQLDNGFAVNGSHFYPAQ